MIFKISSWQEVSKMLINDVKVALSGGKFCSLGEGWFRIIVDCLRLKQLSAVDEFVFKF